MNLPTLDDVEVNGKKVLVRVDLNVPMQDGVITNDARIRAVLPTIRRLHAAGATVILLSHLGRPKSDADIQYTLEPVSKMLSSMLDANIEFHKNWIDGFPCKENTINVCENVRFLSGETNNDQKLSKKIAALADIFVMDAFACAHRAHASTTGVIEYIDTSVIGPLMEQEVNTLAKVLIAPKAPVVAIIGGAKVSTKFKVLENIISKVNHLVIGGGMANTFLAAQGYDVGNSLFEPDFIPEAKKLLALADSLEVNIILPVDAVLGKEMSDNSESKVVSVNEIEKPWMILDAGPESLKPIIACIKTAETILWNGSLGANEYMPFASGTKKLAEAIAESKAFSIAGGGDTIAAIESFQVVDSINYVSTGGGALLEYLEGIKLPVIATMEQKYIRNLE